VIELGSGSGYGAGVLMHEGITEYLALDKFPTHFPEHIASLEKLTFRQMNLPILQGIEDNRFDYAVSFQVIEHIEDDFTFLKEIYRVLKPGGKLILTTPNLKTSLTRNPWHVREYKPQEMVAILSKTFDKVEVNGVYGNEKVMKYYLQNKASVEKITRWDILNLQHRLPRQLLQIPYDILNRLNRKRLHESNNDLTKDIRASDFFIAPLNDDCLDYFAISEKK
jgi:SAM-dependent methyltransferase